MLRREPPRATFCGFLRSRIEGRVSLVAWLLAVVGCGDDVAGDLGGSARDADQRPEVSNDGASTLDGDEGTDATGVVDGPGPPAWDASVDSSTPDAEMSSDANDTPWDVGATDAALDARAPLDADMAADGARPGWRLVWRDEFDATAGAPPDNTKWTPQVGLNGANAELEFYTARAQNVAHDGAGNLVITARRESYMGASYTSARIESGGKFEQMYGRFESRMKLPTGQGLWPAFWIEGNNGSVGWPARGELDIMENVGRDPTSNVGAMHGPGYSGSMDFRATYVLAGGYSSDFHVFAIEWEPNVVRWYVDDNLYETRTPADLAARGGNLRWVYDHPFFIIFNVAVGGRFPGNPDATTPFPQALYIDYVRVYAR